MIIGASEAVTIGEDIRSLAMLQAVVPFTFVPITIFPLVHAVSCGFRLTPLSNVRVAEDSFPDALTLLKAVCPLSFVYLAIGPSVDAVASGFAIQKFAFISVTV